ncbi:Lysocardiolipin acyltransferase 1 [Bonamia ostreae]|uniref:Lysocardiolipin acyltransferase 1 n=1 Tax=Bonamia ostreae TaxID=126728 RepID=A0ABV2AV31_9EUKA
MYYPYPIPFTQLIFFPASNSPRDVHVLIKKYEIADVPKKEEELRKWTMDRFLEKEKQIEYFKRNRKFLDGNSFSEHQKSKLTSFVVLSFLSIVSLRMTGLISQNFVKFWLLMVFMTIAESAQNFLTKV